MALLCDICIAADDTVFFLPETSLGMIPGVAGTQTAPRAIGLGWALDMVLTGRQVKADEALQIGLANQVVPRATLLTAAKSLAYTLSRYDPKVVALAKRAVRQGGDLSLSDGLRLEQNLFAMV